MGDVSAADQYLIELVNAERAAQGIAPLAPNAQLDDAAYDHTVWMGQTNTMSHTGVNGSSFDQRIDWTGYQWRTAAENVAYRYATNSLQNDIAGLHDQWVNSSGHYANLMNANYREIGVGLFESANGRFWGTQVFGTEQRGDPFITGVWYEDIDGDFAYDIGEGLGGATVSARSLQTGLTYTTTSWSGGGYALEVPRGSYEVTFTLAGQSTVADVDVYGSNAKVDVLEAFEEVSDVPFGALYVASFADLAMAFGGSLDEIDAAGMSHVIRGRTEGRLAEGHVWFDPAEYKANYGDLAGMTDAQATEHWVNAGVYEGRLGFDAALYIASYGDLIDAFGANEGAAIAHYASRGRAEGRSATFDAEQYLDNYLDLSLAFGDDLGAAARHYIGSGRDEGRTAIDPLDYVASYGDLVAAFGDTGTLGDVAAIALQHYAANGRDEGRDVSFDAFRYLENYADLQAAFGDDVDAAAFHYITTGYHEGRTDDDLMG